MHRTERTERGSNPALFLTHDASVFDVSVEATGGSAHNPADMNDVNVLYAAEHGTRDRFLEAAALAFSATMECQDVGTLAAPEHKALLKRMHATKRAKRDTALFRRMTEQDFSSDAADYAWLAPWKADAASNALARKTEIRIDTKNTFGQRGKLPSVEGLVVCEATLLGIGMVDEATGLRVVPPDGVLIDRFTIQRSVDKLGTETHAKVVNLFKKKELFLDFIMSCAAEGDRGDRQLLLQYFTPDEITREFVPLYNSLFDLHYRQHPGPNAATAATEEDQDTRQRKAMEMIKAGGALVALTKTPRREERLFPLNKPSETSASVHAERALFLYNDASMIPTTLLATDTGSKRAHDPGDPVDTVDVGASLRAAALHQLAVAQQEEREKQAEAEASAHDDGLAALEICSMTSSRSSRAAPRVRTRLAIARRMPRRMHAAT